MSALPASLTSVDDPLVNAVNKTSSLFYNTVLTVIAEILDPAYTGHRHGRRTTRNRGCTGPLCTKALRDWGRKRAQQIARMEGKPARHSSRTRSYIETDIELARIQEGYDGTFTAWQRQHLEPVHTALLLDYTVCQWPTINWDGVPGVIREYAVKKGLYVFTVTGATDGNK